MKIKVLVDNNTYIDQYYYGEPGVSYYIEDDDIKLLMDVGYSDLFMCNAKKMNVDLDVVSKIVITHGHDDHTKGLKYFFKEAHKKALTLIAHPGAFNEKMAGEEPIGAPLSEIELREKCHVVLTKEPLKITKHLTFLGEIPKLNDFETRTGIGTQISEGRAITDYLVDDSALVYQSMAGIYILTGCSHSGICNIIEYAKQVTKEERVIGILGGFHIFKKSHQLEKTIDYFKNNHIKELYPCHCTSFEAKAEIHKVIPIQEVGVGLEINW